jgi:DtxR family Mn-dependent transcriptional regulator
MASISIEDFLKNVFTLINLGGKATTTKLARRLNVSNAAITDMSRKLARQNLINYEKYKDITLSPEGEKIALSVIRRHRLWELFLNDVLNIPWENVHDEAERLEHHTSEYLINEIDKFLGFPQVDPHGDPIPDAEGKIADQEYVCLLDVAAPASFILKRIVEHTSDTIAYLNANNISLDEEMLVKEINHEENMVVVSHMGTDLEMPFGVAEKIFVEVVS